MPVLDSYPDIAKMFKGEFSPKEISETNSLIDDSALDKIKKLVNIDPHTEESLKTKLLGFIDGPDPIGHLFAGTAGSLAAYTVSKFLKMKPETQLLMSIAGFGVGELLASSIGHPARGVTYSHGKTMFLQD